MAKMLSRLCLRVEEFCKRRESYVMIPRVEEGATLDYLGRSFLSRIPGRFAAFLHHVHRSDDDMHDHPWDNLSIILSGGYYENSVEIDPAGIPSNWRRVWRGPGSVVFRRAESVHCLEKSESTEEVWTLFIHFRRRRKWGFWKQEKGDVLTPRRWEWHSPPQVKVSSLRGFLFPRPTGDNYD